MEESKRGIFALDGITGMLIATVLLLSILVGLSYAAIVVQQGSADTFYKIENEKSIKMISTESAANRVIVQ